MEWSQIAGIAALAIIAIVLWRFAFRSPAKPSGNPSDPPTWAP